MLRRERERLVFDFEMAEHKGQMVTLKCRLSQRKPKGSFLLLFSLLHLSSLDKLPHL